MAEHLNVVDMDTADQKVFVILNFGETVSDLRTAIAGIVGAPCSEQILFFRGCLVHYDQDPLSKFGIKADDFIHLHRKTNARLFRINVVGIGDQNSIPVIISGRETVRVLKNQINYITGVPPLRQLLTANGVVMRDSDAIRDYSHKWVYSVVLYTEPRDAETTFMVMIENDELNGAIVGWEEVEPRDTVFTLMRALRRRVWFPVTKRRMFWLWFKGRRLQGPETMAELGIGEADFIRMFF
ncbi:hypothetical protein QJS10_CPB11g00446 [Acorus calamus]|uniref:Ubiquitin-like domain-containing protein n=1 Tax=Acorus calamus TaxID=4465 RepID=A0AAV9DUN7_ACOCL|nr:hypothetical protein QJS10_CPB11g00446 [Acorus calamus]